MEKRPRRRVRTEPAPGSDPAPQRPGAAGRAAEDAAEDADEDADEGRGDRADGNDERLRREVPPHW